MKNHIRDYATAAFQFYAKEGGAEKYKKKIYKEVIQEQLKREGKGGISKPTEAMVMRAEKEVEDKLAEIRDLEAVEKTIAELSAHTFMGETTIKETSFDRVKIIKAIELVYFINAGKELEKGDIKDRVHKASLEIPASERQIYKWLSKARELFAEKRELRI
jgi:hypothetical protein